MAGQKPLVAINADFKAVGRREASPSISYLFSGYYDKVMKAGGLPIVIPPYGDGADMDRILDMVDGVIMVGGADLNPINDGFEGHPLIHPMHQRREMFDRTLIRKVYERRLPFFGIGSGMQLLNVSQGGTLFLHIPEDLTTALPHADPDDPNHRHALLVEPGSLFDRVYGDNAIMVNSMHHMAVDDVAEGFLATAKCPDSVIEGIESIRDDWFAFGTQFHPEAPSATEIDLRIFGEFISGIVKRSGKSLDLGSADEVALPAAAPAREKSRKRFTKIGASAGDGKKSRSKKSTLRSTPVFRDDNMPLLAGK